MYDDLGIDFCIKAFHFGDGYSLNYYRAFFVKGNEMIALCSCSGGHQTAAGSLDCMEVVKNSAPLVSNSL